MGKSSLEFDTLAAQAGLRIRVGESISTAPPIDPSTTFTYDTVEGVHAALAPDGSGFAYARNANPTVVMLEEAVAGLEGADEVVAFGSGMAAIQGAIAGVGIEAGDVVVAATDLYGVSRSLLSHLSSFGVETRWIDILDESAVDSALEDPNARMLFFETISNPLLRVPDVARLAEIAHRHRAVAVVDNTFATPYLFRPLDHGVDVVVHSATKYIGGHGDSVAGLVATNRSHGNRIRGTRTVTGGILSPFEAWLTLRGLRTLPVRMERHCSNALELAGWLERQPWVERVYYPGLERHPQHALSDKLFGGRYGGMVSFDLAAEQARVIAFINGLRLITPGTSLGDVESLVLYPPLTSHRTLLPEELTAFGIGEGLIRLSVGLESVADLEADLEGAARDCGLEQAQTAGRSSG